MDEGGEDETDEAVDETAADDDGTAVRGKDTGVDEGAAEA